MDDMMDILRWISGGYFHDGILYNIQNTDNNLVIAMESCEIFPEDINKIQAIIPLSPRTTINGKLYLIDIRNITADDIPIKTIHYVYSSCEIFDIEINDKHVHLYVLWQKTSRISEKKWKLDEEKWVVYEIDATKIYWENLPNINFKNPVPMKIKD